MTGVEVLIAAANTELASALATMLAELGYSVPAVVASGSALLRQAAVLQPDLVLLDLQLLGKSDATVGQDVVERLNLPLVYLCDGPRPPAPVDDSAQVGQPGYLLYPVGTPELARAIEMACHRYAPEQRLSDNEEGYRAQIEDQPALELRVKERTAELRAANAALRAEIADRKQAERDLQENERRHRRRSSELEALHRVSLSLNALMDTTALFRVIEEQAVALLEAIAGAGFIYDTQRNRLRLEVGVGVTADYLGATLEPGEGAAGQALVTGQSVVIRDYAAWPGRSPVFAGDPRISQVMAVPLKGAKGVLGVVTVCGAADQDFDDHDRWLVELFAAQASVALENARLHAETQRRATELAALNKASQAIVSTLNLESVLQVVITEVKELFSAQGASVLLRDPGTNELVFASVVGPRATDLVGTRMPMTKGIAGWAIEQRKSVLINDVQDDPRFYGDIDSKSGLITASMAASPLTFRGTVWGVVEVINKASGPFEERDLELLDALTRSAAIAFENARLYQVERDQLQRLQESQARLIQAEKMSALGRLTASIAHEINNPLQAIHSCLSLIQEELRREFDPNDMQHDLSIAEGEVNRISNIVRRLREFYRPARAGIHPTDARAVLESMLDLVGKQLQNSNVNVELDWPADLPPIQANPDQLKQVFVNLALNAVDAMPAGGVLRINATFDHGPARRGHRSGPGVYICFQDSGEGIADELLPRVFEPFFTTKPGGTGLGLSISYEIIQSFGGEITVTSELGLGTVFTLQLPVYEA